LDVSLLGRQSVCMRLYIFSSARPNRSRASSHQARAKKRISRIAAYFMHERRPARRLLAYPNARTNPSALPIIPIGTAPSPITGNRRRRWLSINGCRRVVWARRDCRTQDHPTEKPSRNPSGYSATLACVRATRSYERRNRNCDYDCDDYELFHVCNSARLKTLKLIGIKEI
jgi:hypothetical protein